MLKNHYLNHINEMLTSGLEIAIDIAEDSDNDTQVLAHRLAIKYAEETDRQLAWFIQNYNIVNAELRLLKDNTKS